MKIFMIAKNNIKKAKFATATLIILIAMATIFMYVGISVLANMDTFIENKNTELNGAHFVSITDGIYDNEIDTILKSIGGYKTSEREDVLMSLSSKFQDVNTHEEAYALFSILLNLNTDREISKVKLIDKANQFPENGVIVPYVLKVSQGYQTGDTLKFMVGEQSMDLFIAGFYEDLMFATPSNVSMYKLYVGDQQFRSLLNQPAYGFKSSYSAVLTNDINGSEEFETQFMQNLKPIIPEGTGIYNTLNYETMKTGVSIFINIILLLSLVCVFALGLYYNFVVDNRAMVKLIGLETAEVQLKVQENDELRQNEISAMHEVKNTVKLDTFGGVIKYNGNESWASTRITQDYGRLEVNTCVNGRMPVNDNEIAITSIVLDNLGAKIGNTVAIEYSGLKKEFLVVGVTQQFNNLGKGAAITTDGMKKLAPAYEEKI